MSILDSLTKAKTFDSHEDVVKFIKQFEDENVYLQREKVTSVKAFINDQRKKVKLDDEIEFKSMQYIFPHFVTHKSRAKKGLRLNHGIANDCLVQIQFFYDDALKKLKITKLKLEHKNHPVSEGHLKIYARKT
jgi:hypothetical protein